jgi:hypothetical protein
MKVFVTGAAGSVMRFDGNHAALAIGPSMLNVSPCA